MSEAFFSREAGDRHTAQSAGSQADPDGGLHPEVVEVMAEIGVDLKGNRPTPLTADAVSEADLVVTMGCGDECPVVPATDYVDWDLQDPKDQSLEKVREIRDEIEHRVIALIRELDAPVTET